MSDGDERLKETGRRIAQKMGHEAFLRLVYQRAELARESNDCIQDHHTLEDFVESVLYDLGELSLAIELGPVKGDPEILDWIEENCEVTASDNSAQDMRGGASDWPYKKSLRDVVRKRMQGEEDGDHPAQVSSPQGRMRDRLLKFYPAPPEAPCHLYEVKRLARFDLGVSSPTFYRFHTSLIDLGYIEEVHVTAGGLKKTLWQRTQQQNEEGE